MCRCTSSRPAAAYTKTITTAGHLKFETLGQHTASSGPSPSAFQGWPWWRPLPELRTKPQSASTRQPREEGQFKKSAAVLSGRASGSAKGKGGRRTTDDYDSSTWAPTEKPPRRCTPQTHRVTGSAVRTRRARAAQRSSPGCQRQGQYRQWKQPADTPAVTRADAGREGGEGTGQRTQEVVTSRLAHTQGGHRRATDRSGDLPPPHREVSPPDNTGATPYRRGGGGGPIHNPPLCPLAEGLAARLGHDPAPLSTGAAPPCLAGVARGSLPGQPFEIQSIVLMMHTHCPVTCSLVIATGPQASARRHGQWRMIFPRDLDLSFIGAAPYHKLHCNTCIIHRLASPTSTQTCRTGIVFLSCSVCAVSSTSDEQEERSPID